MRPTANQGIRQLANSVVQTRGVVKVQEVGAERPLTRPMWLRRPHARNRCQDAASLSENLTRHRCTRISPPTVEITSGSLLQRCPRGRVHGALSSPQPFLRSALRSFRIAALQPSFNVTFDVGSSGGGSDKKCHRGLGVRVLPWRCVSVDLPIEIASAAAHGRASVARSVSQWTSPHSRVAIAWVPLPPAISICRVTSNINGPMSSLGFSDLQTRTLSSQLHS